MRGGILLFLTLVTTAACSRTISVARAPGRTAGTVTTAESSRGASHGATPARGPRKLGGVPPGHYPPRGLCRLWFPGRPPGRQPAVTSCESLRGAVPQGAFILFNGDAWDGGYNWKDRAQRHPGSVPQIIVELTTRTRR